MDSAVVSGHGVIVGHMELNLDFEDMPITIIAMWLKHHPHVKAWCDRHMPSNWRSNIHTEYLGRTSQYTFACRLVMVLDTEEQRVLWNMRPAEMHI